MAATEVEDVATFPFCAAAATPAPDIKERSALELYDDGDADGTVP